MIETTLILSSTEHRVTCSIRLFAFTNSATMNCISDPTLWSNSPMILAKLALKMDVISLALLLFKEFNFNFKMTRSFISKLVHICVCCLTLRKNIFACRYDEETLVNRLIRLTLSVQRWEFVMKMWFLDPFVFCNDFI